MYLFIFKKGPTLAKKSLIYFRPFVVVAHSAPLKTLQPHNVVHKINKQQSAVLINHDRLHQQAVEQNL